MSYILKQFNTLLPRAYEDYVEMARSMMNDRNKEQLRHMLTFRFKRHSHYNLPGEWLELMEMQMHCLVQELFDG